MDIGGENKVAGSRLGERGIRPEVSSAGGLSDSNISACASKSGDSSKSGPVNIVESLSVMRGVSRKSLRGVSPGDSPNVSKDGVHGDVRNSFGSKGDMSG
jgi:hypothetical protein